MTTGTLIALVALVVALAFGGWRALSDGRFRRSASASPGATGPSQATRACETSRTPETEETPMAESTTWATVAASAKDASLGERATLVQFSSAFCAPCRATRRVLDDVAGVVPGVVHLEIDAEHHLELVRALDVRRTPTTIVLDSTGQEVARAAGAPRKEQVLAALPLDA
jgi:thiol-disulfide isomerase/thioredoxin